MKARQRGDDVEMMLVQVLEGGILPEDVHALSLRENDADGAVLEDQPRFAIEEN